MVMEDGTTGKLGDCGESRRVAFDSTMTSTGTPLWAAPELLGGLHYGVDVDTYSLGIVMYEITERKTPYDFYKKEQGGSDYKMMLSVSKGLLRPELSEETCESQEIGRPFLKLFRRCTAFEPLERPAIGDVIVALESIVADREAGSRFRGGKPSAITGMSENGLERITSKKKKMRHLEKVVSPWSKNAAILKAFQRFEDSLGADLPKFQTLRNEVVSELGQDAVSPSFGFYNPVMLYRFLVTSSMDVADAKRAIFGSALSRTLLNFDEKRKRIVEEDLSFDTVPFATKMTKYVPINVFSSRDYTESISYFNIGSKSDMKGLVENVTADEMATMFSSWMELGFLVRDRAKREQTKIAREVEETHRRIVRTRPSLRSSPRASGR